MPCRFTHKTINMLDTSVCTTNELVNCVVVSCIFICALRSIPFCVWVNIGHSNTNGTHVQVRLKIARNARIIIVDKYQSFMDYNLPIIFKRIRIAEYWGVEHEPCTSG
eukprot:COSAG05_NODE_287_length_12131_cov_3.148022_7_plen_108_part_00